MCVYYGTVFLASTVYTGGQEYNNFAKFLSMFLPTTSSKLQKQAPLAFPCASGLIGEHIQEHLATAIVVGCVSAVGLHNVLDNIIRGITNTSPFVMLMQFTFYYWEC
jgi:hypothetical protein